MSNSEPTLYDKLSKAFPHLTFQGLNQGLIRVKSNKPIDADPVVRFIEEQGVEVNEARRMRLSLEDVFVQITGIEPDTMKKEKEKAGGP